MPMDIGAVDVKGKGKGKNKDKGKCKAKDKPDAEVTCYYCNKVGHRQAAGAGRQHRRRREKGEC